MSKQHVISKFRFLEYGKPAPRGSRFKGTINIASLIGWVDYTAREKAADTQKEKTLHKDGLLGYTSHNGEIRTFSSDGWLDKNKMNIFKGKIIHSFKENGDIFWDTVVSLRNYQDSFSSGMYDVNDYAGIVSKLLPSYFKSIGFDPDNMLWWMNYHNNKKNPHMHIAFLEIDKTRTKGKLPKDYIDKYKSMWLKELGLREEFTKEFSITPKAYMQEKDMLHKDLLSKVRINFNDKNLRDLYSMLPKNGRLSYNSKPMKAFHKQINMVINALLADEEIAPTYEAWKNKVETLDKFQNHLAGEKISHFKQTEIDKLYTRLGNMILDGAKHKETEEVCKTEIWFDSSYLSKGTIDPSKSNIRVRIQGIPIAIEIPMELVKKDDRNICTLNIFDTDEFYMNLYKKHIDAWKDKDVIKSLKIDGSQLKDIIKTKNLDTIKGASIEDNSKTNELPGNLPGSKKVIHKITEKSLEKNIQKGNLKDPPVLKMGVRKNSTIMHNKPLSAILRKGAKRILNQDEQEKERDLEKFIREYEDQQIRSQERNEVYDY